MATEEQVMVVERRVVEEVGMFHGLAFDVERYFGKLFAKGAVQFMARSKAEKDPSYKQLIPYVIITSGDKYLTYVRGKGAGEKRLVAKRSIGIGGHINPIDQTLFSAEPYKIYLEAVEREVAEEVCVEAGHRDKIVALLNDDSTEVGQVHLGIVHLWTLDSPMVKKGEKMITQMEFMSVSELEEVRESMETWSSLCLEKIAEIKKREQV